jgi:hypothetical protein
MSPQSNAAATSRAKKSSDSPRASKYKKGKSAQNATSADSDDTAENLEADTAEDSNEAEAAAPKAKKAGGRGKKKAEPAPEGNPIEQEWLKLMSDHQEAPMKTYSPKGVFSLGDKMSHPTFGEGIVGKLIYPNKLEVIFRHEVKILIYMGHTHA